MFGSNFSAQFGLVGPPWDNLDAYGGIFGPNAPVTPLPGSVGLGETIGQQAPVAGTPGMQPQSPAQANTYPGVSVGSFTPETFYSPDAFAEQSATNQRSGEDQGAARALSPGALSLPAGLTTEFAKGR